MEPVAGTESSSVDGSAGPSACFQTRVQQAQPRGHMRANVVPLSSRPAPSALRPASLPRIHADPPALQEPPAPGPPSPPRPHAAAPAPAVTSTVAASTALVVLVLSLLSPNRGTGFSRSRTRF